MGNAVYEHLIARWTVCVIGLSCILWAVPSRAMIPAALVVEVAAGSANAPLALCSNVRVRRGELQIGKNLAHWLEQRGSTRARWYARTGLRRLEDVRLLVLFRTPERCEMLLSDRKQGMLPSAWRSQGKLPFHSWRLLGETIYLKGRSEFALGEHTYKRLFAPGSNGLPLRLYHHGRLEIILGLHAPKVRAVGMDDAVSVHLEGPGDEAHFVFHAWRSGSLIIERTPGNMPDVNLFLGKNEQDMRPRGMIDLRTDESSLIVFRHSGAKPLDLDAGFLFTPDLALTCDMDAVQISMHAWSMTLRVRNAGDEPIMLSRPSAGTVDWYAGGKLIAAARPGSLPPVVALGSQSSLRYESILSADIPKVPDSARVNLGARHGALFCVPMRSPKSERKKINQ